MKQKVTIKVINEPQSGVSKSTGNTWRRQDIVVGWREAMNNGYSREQLVAGCLHGESIDRLAQINPTLGVTEVEVELVFSTEMYNGRVYNRVTIFI